MITLRNSVVKWFIGFAFLFLLAFPPTASLQSIPAPSTGRAWLAQRGKETGLFKVISFRKTNGINHGDGVYTMEFEAVVSCLDTNVPAETGPFAMTLTACDRPACRKGKTAKIEDAITLQKTERGWRFHHCGQ